MSRKDFELIAAMIRGSCLWDVAPSIGYTMAHEAADALSGTNPLFDRGRFLDACMPENWKGRDYTRIRDGALLIEEKRALIAQGR